MKYFYSVFTLSALIFFGFFPAALSADSEDEPDISNLENLLNTKISSASKYEQTINEAPASISIISSEDIQRYGYQNISDILNSVKGLSVRTDRAYSYLSFRGFDVPSDYGNKILLLINGHTLNENYYGAAVWGNDLGIDVDMIDRVEILRGPGSAVYGTGAMLGVVNIILKKGKDIDGIKIKGETGSLGRFGATISAGGTYEGDADFTVSGKYLDLKGEDLFFNEYLSEISGDGVYRDNDNEKLFGLNASFNYSDFSLLAYYTSRDKGIPTASFSTIFDDPDTKTTDDRGFLELKYKNQISEKLALSMRVYYNYYYYHGVYPYLDSERYLENDENKSDWRGAELQSIWDISPDNRIVSGFEYIDNYHTNYRYWYMESEYYNKNNPYSILSVYLEDIYQVFENFSISAGLRYDKYSRAINESALSPRAALIYNMSNSTVFKFLYNQAFRAPNIYEIFYKYSDEAIDNPNLNSEKISAFELVWEQELGEKSALSVSLFNFNMNKLIIQRKVINPADTASFVNQFQNIDKTGAFGIEANLIQTFDKAFTGYFNYSFQDARDITGENSSHLVNSPYHLAKAGLSYSFWDHIILSAEGVYESERKTLSSDDYPAYDTDGFFLVNMNLSILPQFKADDGLRAFFNRISIIARVSNLFDKKYKLPGSYDLFPIQAVPQFGRNITVNLSVKI